LRWETSPSELRSLNPVCCKVSNDVVVWPYYILGIFVVFLALSLLVAGASNISIANAEKYDEEIYRSYKVIDFLILGVVAILGLILIFYLVFRSSPSFKHKYSGGVPGFKVDDQGKLIPKDSFAPVPSYISSSESINPNCIKLIGESIPKFEIK
jgi:hypothetical protein